MLSGPCMHEMRVFLMNKVYFYKAYLFVKSRVFYSELKFVYFVPVQSCHLPFGCVFKVISVLSDLTFIFNLFVYMNLKCISYKLFFLFY